MTSDRSDWGTGDWERDQENEDPDIPPEDCEYCGDSGVNEVYGGYGNVLEMPCGCGWNDYLDAQFQARLAASTGEPT